MADQNVTVIRYDDDTYQQLLTEFETLSTFAAVADWDQRAQTEIDRILGVLQSLIQSVAEQTEARDKAKREHEQKSFFKRTFGSPEGLREITKRLEQWQGFQDRLEEMSSRLQELIDFTPSSKEEQKALLKELRQRKKELQLEKREINADMRAIREKSRASAASADMLLAGFRMGGLGSPKLSAWQRRQARYARQSALKPQEDAKAAIERQLVELERDIMRAQRFTS